MRPPSHFEGRKNQRIPTPTGLWVSCKSDDRRTTLRVQDFSVSGALLVTEEAIPVGTRLELLFSLPEVEIRVLAGASRLVCRSSFQNCRLLRRYPRGQSGLLSPDYCPCSDCDRRADVYYVSDSMTV